MNKIHKYIAISIFTVLFTIYYNLGFAQDIVQDIHVSFSTGQVDKLKQHMNNNLDVSFDQNKSIYSKSQALALLKQRFDSEPPKKYKLIKSSDLRNKTLVFLIAEYQSTKARYLIYLSLKKDNEVLKISEIHFESQ